MADGFSTRKTFTTNGHYADVCVAMAVTDKSKGSKEFPHFILEKGKPRVPPRKKGKQTRHEGERYLRSRLQRLFVPSANLLGAEGKGFVNTLQVLDGGRISIAALALGMAQARTRRQ